MITSLFSQKNICAALGFVMAITIVWKATVETKLANHTALIEYSEPAYNKGEHTNLKADVAFEQRQLKPRVTAF